MTHRKMAKCRELNGPFTLQVADGRSFVVPHWDFVFLPPRATSVTLALPAEESSDELDYHVIPLLMVSGVSHGEQVSS